jgi:hypothetical protein
LGDNCHDVRANDVGSPSSLANGPDECLSGLVNGSRLFDAGFRIPQDVVKIRPDHAKLEPANPTQVVG